MIDHIPDVKQNMASHNNIESNFYIFIFLSVTSLFAVCSSSPTLTTDRSSIFKYELDRIPQDQTKIYFDIKSGKEAYISLSNQKYSLDDMYVVVIGDRRGRQASIRKCLQCANVASKLLSQTEFLSDEEFRSFWVSWEDGVIAVGRGDEAAAFMEWREEEQEEALVVNYVGVATGSDDGVGEFRFCDIGMFFQLWLPIFFF